MDERSQLAPVLAPIYRGTWNGGGRRKFTIGAGRDGAGGSEDGRRQGDWGGGGGCGEGVGGGGGWCECPWHACADGRAVGGGVVTANARPSACGASAGWRGDVRRRAGLAGKRSGIH